AHGAEIVTLATTVDGTAVVSADRLGGIRLWPSLDGSREPVVIQGTAPRSLTLARDPHKDGDGFVIGMLDAAGGVRLIRTSATGAVRERTNVTRDQPVLQIEHTSEGLLLLRADQVIELVGNDGAVRAQLTAEPGNHVVSLVTHGDRVLALVREGRNLHGQWIVIDRGARWGKATPKLPFEPVRAVLSPDGALLAVSRARHLHPTLIDVATGVPRKTALCVSEGWPRSEGHGPDVSELLRSENAPAPVGFLGSTVVACSVITSLVWWNTSGTQADTMVGSISLSNVPRVVTARAVIAGAGPSLAIATPTANAFLGYGFHDVGQLRAGPGGLLISGDQHAYVLDPALRERARLELGRGGSDWSDVAMLDDRYAILTLRRHASNGVGHQLAVFDGVTKTEHQRLPYATNSMQVTYEPTTRLLATSDGTRSLVVRFDPESHTFGAPIRLASAIVTSRIALVDPALTGGLAALEIDSTSDGILVGEIGEADLVPGTLVQPKTTYRLPGTLRAVDRAGRLYMQAPVVDAPVVAVAAPDAGTKDVALQIFRDLTNLVNDVQIPGCDLIALPGALSHQNGRGLF
ncbi:MAG: hypothetical protein H7138_05900, partial [Myxococcales bacterium]|nr:hypothetical protein [Myxococcales bacterium]